MQCYVRDLISALPWAWLADTSQTQDRNIGVLYVKVILKYLRRTKEYMLVYKSSDLLRLGYTDSDFQTDKDKRKSTSGCVFTLGGGAVIWRSVKQKCIADSTMEAEYVAASEAAKEAIWF